MRNPLSVGVLYNTPAQRFSQDPTHIAAEDDTVESAKEVHEALREKGIQAALVPVTETTIVEVVRTLSSYDLVFNLIEWTGIDTHYAMETFDAMDALGIRYTGATKENYRITCDKILMKEALDREGLPNASWQTFTTGNEPVSPAVMYPSIIKVASEHSSVGLSKDSIVYDEAALRRVVRGHIARFHQPVIAEAFLSGREFQVTILEVGGETVVLPPAEIVFAKGTDAPLLTYESRWDVDHADYGNSTVCVAVLDDRQRETLSALCRQAFSELSFRDYARFDIRCDSNNTPYFLEVNSNPGLGDDSEYGMTLSYRASGMTFADFIGEIVTSALRRVME